MARIFSCKKQFSFYISQELEERLQQKHSEELQTLKETQKQAMDSFKLEMEQELQTLRFELEDEGKAMLGTVLPCYYVTFK